MMKKILFLFLAVLITGSMTACGLKFQKVLCPNCGVDITKSPTYCSHCNTNFGNGGATTTTPSTGEPADDTKSETEKNQKKDNGGESKVPLLKLPKITTIHNHDYKAEITQDRTCTKDGIKTYTCKVCKDSYTQTVKKTGHSFYTRTTKYVTCTTDGEEVTRCYNCDETKTKVIKAKGHEWVNATCTRAKYCDNCGETEGSALGHTTRNGTCSRCNQVFSLEDYYTIDLPYYLPKYLTYSKSKRVYENGTYKTVYLTQAFNVSSAKYKLTDNGDGTANVQLTITLTGANDDGNGVTVAYFGCDLLGNTDYERKVSFIPSSLSTRTVSVTYSKVVPGTYSVYFYSIDD